MTITAKLQFGNNDLHIYNQEYLVVECNIHSAREYDAFHPTSLAQDRSIQVTVVAQSSADLSLQEWYYKQTPQTGRLLLEMTDYSNNADANREILFEDAVCYWLEERYDINDNNRRLIVLKFVTEKTTIDDVDLN